MRMRSMIAVAVMGIAMGATAVGQKPQYPDLPSETPEHFEAPTAGMDYARREAMIPMRDGVKLHTVILVPNGAAHAGILMTRTPYNASALTMNAPSQHLGSALWGYDNAVETIISGRVHPRGAGYSRQVWQRGRLCDEPADAWAARIRRRWMSRRIRTTRSTGW